MTVEAKYLDLVNEGEKEFNENDNEHNNENIYPMSGELMVAIRPLISNCNLSLISKINIPKSKELSEKAINKRCEKNLFPMRMSSPIKRTVNHVVDTVNKELPLAKKSLTNNTNINAFPGIMSSSNLTQQLSQSADSSNLQSALKHVQDNLSQSCFAELTSEKKSPDIDSELTCLNWLQETDLLKEFSPGKKNRSSCEQESKVDIKVGCNQDLNIDMKDPLSSINDVDKSLQKPAYSFSTLIFMAIESTPSKRLPVKDIYQWIQDNFPYFQRAPIGWKNSIRHNLSLNKSFKKVDKEKCIGKGSLWTIDHQARAGLVQQLRKTSMCSSYPYSKPPYANGCSRYFLKDKKLHRRDSTGRFVPNHDDAEFDVAAAMCSLSSTALIDYQNDCTQSNGFDYVSSEELLQIWRTCIEPNDGRDESTCANSDSFMQNHRIRPRENAKYSIEDFLDEVRFKSRQINCRKRTGNVLSNSLNISMDEDYEFDQSDGESTDDEMRENMLRLVEKESDECLRDSGYFEGGTLKTATMLDHSYSKSIQSLVRPHTKREVKGIDALLHLANAASRELENLNSKEKTVTDTKSYNTPAYGGFKYTQFLESSEVFTAEKSWQYPYNSSAGRTSSND